MEKDYVTYLQHSGEPEREDCSTGIIPSNCAESAEDSKGQEILVLILTSMSKYLFQHYRLTMYSYLNRSLKNGNMDRTVGFHVKNRVIDRHVCSFGNPTFWRVNRETFIANVRVSLCLDTSNGNRTWEGFLSLWFQMGETVSCSVEYMGSIEEMEDENLPMLSSYLVPIFSNRQINSGYTLDTSELPSGVTVTGYTGTKGETLMITANAPYVMTIKNSKFVKLGMDSDWWEFPALCGGILLLIGGAAAAIIIISRKKRRTGMRVSMNGQTVSETT